jgi:glucose/arabinose dehydrogenase
VATVLVPSTSSAVTFQRQLVHGGMAFPAAFTFAPDGRIFYGERNSGQVRIFNPATSGDTLFFTVPNLSTGNERGLLGVELHPSYPSMPFVYIYATRTVNSQSRGQILKVRDTAGTGTNMQVIFNNNATDHHNGGRILFGPDNMLYMVNGDKTNAANSQNLNTVSGKMLRMTANGGVPSNNPFGNSLVWAYGIRNSFGFDFDPETGRLWQDENGPSCNDELNRIPRGRNMGWGPSQDCGSPPDAEDTNRDGPNIMFPRRIYNPTSAFPRLPALTGMAFCDGCGLGSASEGSILMADFNFGLIRRVILNSTRLGVMSQSVVYDHPSTQGGILSVETSPSGQIYFSDGNEIFKLVM